jgi:amino acid transporter
VIGIRESAASNTALVLLKTGVVFFVIAVGAGYVSSRNWFDIPAEQRVLPEQAAIAKAAADIAKAEDSMLSGARDLGGLFGKSARTVLLDIEAESKRELKETYQIPARSDLDRRADVLRTQATVLYLREQTGKIAARLREQESATPEQIKAMEDRAASYTNRMMDHLKNEHDVLDISGDNLRRAEMVIAVARKKAADYSAEKWGLLGTLGLNKYLTAIDDSVRSRYFPYGFSGVMLGAALVFFAFIGFDSISTHSEEAIRPQRDVPIGIIASLCVCTILYIAVSLVITGMQPYPFIDRDAAVASAFRIRSEEGNTNGLLRASAGLIAAGGLAGMTSVILITLLSQARIFLAMARDQLLPPAIFGAVHEKFRTPHLSTMLTGGLITVVAAFTPIEALEEMVNIGTLFAFVVVCAAVLILRLQNPEAHRPFRCPVIWIIAPLGILVNLTMMLFLTVDSWLRLMIWMGIGLAIYFSYGIWSSTIGRKLRGEVAGGTN